MTMEEAIKIIQVVERARQGRLRAKLNLQSRNMNRIYRTKDPGTAGVESAAICIQKVYQRIHSAPLVRLAPLFPLKYVCFDFMSGVEGIRTEEEGEGRPCGREDFSQNGLYDRVVTFFLVVICYKITVLIS